LSWPAAVGADDDASPGPNGLTTRTVADPEAAYQVLRDSLLDLDDQERRVYLFQEKIASTVVIPLWFSEATLSGGPGWLFFIDDAPRANWEHPCRYVLVSEDGELNVIHARTPPRNMEEYKELTSGSTPSSDVSPGPLTDKTLAPDAASRAFTPAEHRYAVILSGGYNWVSNPLRYWNDCSYFFSTLKQNGFLDENIYVLISDGTDPAFDTYIDYEGTTASSPLDLDGDGLPDTRYSATKANITLVFDELAAKLGPGDLLSIFITDHGGIQEGNQVPFHVPDTTVYLWGEKMTGDELAAEVNKVNAGIVAGIFEQCYSGGLVEKLAGPNRVLMSAARWWESSFAMGYFTYDEFSHYATRALAEPLLGDSNGDGQTTMEEAYLYALTNDSWQSEDAGGGNSVAGLIQAVAAAPLWDDLTTSDPENDIYIDAKLNYVTVSWDAKTQSDQRPVHVAARLYSDGTINFYYGQGNRHTSLVAGRDKTIGLSIGGEAHLSFRNGASVLDQSPGVSFVPAVTPRLASSSDTDSKDTGCFLSASNQ